MRRFKKSKKFFCVMKIDVKKEEFTKVDVEGVVLGIYEGGKSKLLDELPAKLKAEVTRLYSKKVLKGEPGEVRVINTLGLIKARNLILIGLGKEKDLNLEELRRMSGRVLKTAKCYQLQSLALILQFKQFDPIELGAAVAEGLVMGNYTFNKFKSKKDKKKVERIVLLGEKSLEKGIMKGREVGEAVNYTRELVNLPPAAATPTYLGKEAMALKGGKISVKVYGRAEIKRMGMGGLIAVGQGSEEEQKFIVINYHGGGKKKVALVGKGITFDAGGYNLKPTRYIEEMKQDMAGAATVLGVIKAAQKLKLKVNLLGLIPSCENLVSGGAYKPGDVLKSYNGKTIEVTNTDAEGRLILADALGYADKQKANYIIDIATLTGAVVVALGYWATGVLSKDNKLVAALVKAGNESGDRVWELPMWDDYKDLVKSEIADVCNSHKNYDAGTIEGGMFLSNFVEKTAWAHLDIGGTAFFNEPKHYFAKGGTGAGVRLLVKWLENLKN